MKAIVKIPNVSWRDGRPRFNPGPKLRKLGFKGEDLRHADGRWFDLREAEDWIKAKQAEIVGRRAKKAAGARLRPLDRPSGYTIEDMFEDLWRTKSFQKKAESTQIDYKSKAKCFARHDPQLYGVAASEMTQAAIIGLHEKLWDGRGLNMANGMIAVLRKAYSEAVRRGRVTANPCLRLGLERPDERLRCATVAEIAALMKAADTIEPECGGANEARVSPADAPNASIGDAIVIALFTGQRQGDVLALDDEGTVDGLVQLRQSKTGALVSVRALPQLVERLAIIRERKRRSGRIVKTIVVDPGSGKRWVASTFRHRFADVRAAAVAAGCTTLADFRFQDLRDTAVTWLARAGCTIPEIASVTGHSYDTIHKILRHYLVLDQSINDAAMAKLLAWAEREGVKV